MMGAKQYTWPGTYVLCHRPMSNGLSQWQVIIPLLMIKMCMEVLLLPVCTSMPKLIGMEISSNLIEISGIKSMCTYLFNSISTELLTEER